MPAFGIGSALSRDYTATGTPTKGRGQRMDESLEIISRLWSEEQVTFAGRHFQLDRASIAPRPVQKPLPLWVGGAAEAAIERTARWGTGWQAGIETAAQIAPVIAAIKQRADELGRPIDVDHFGAGFGYRFGRRDDPISEKYLKGLSARLAANPPTTMSRSATPTRSWRGSMNFDAPACTSSCCDQSRSAPTKC